MEQLAANGHTETTRARHATYYLALADHALDTFLHRPQDVIWLDYLSRDRPNLQVALRWFGDRGDAQACLRLVMALGPPDGSVESVFAESVHTNGGLTARESEVIELIARGMTNREIAELLVVSVRTVERHITNLYAKIGVRGKAGATAYALRHGLVTS
jgi:DNA-binding CsgD family transcriptional regulator